MKKIFLSILLLGWFGQSMAQSIQRIEYFIDTDPGVGAGVAVLFSGTTTATANLSIPLGSGLAVGFHKFYIRAKNTNGAWSIVQQQNFFKTNLPASTPNIAKLEYFIDTDPGFGMANAVNITSGQSVTKALNIPLPANLPLGFHKFSIRAKDASGKWSVVYQQNFFKNDILTILPNLVKLEYFVDTDPGFGQGIDIPVGNNASINAEPVFSLPSNLPLGVHSLSIRAKDALGKWSIVSQKTFTNCPGLSISAPFGLVSCSDSLILRSTKSHPSAGGTIAWYQNQTLLPINTDSLVVYNNGTYRAELSTPGCVNVASNTLQVNVAESISLSLKAQKPLIYCNENQLITIDSLNSTFPIGVSALFDWYRNDTLILANTTQKSFATNIGGEYKGVLRVASFPSTCNTFNMDSVLVEKQNLQISIGPESSPGQVILCPGTSFTLSVTDNVNDPLNIQWFKDGNLISGQTSSQLIINTAGAYQAKASIGACLNVASNSIQATVNNLVNNDVPVLSSPQNLSTVYCGGEEITINATGCSLGVLWPPSVMEVSGSQAKYITSASIFPLTVTCKGSCLGAQSNTLTILSSGYGGSAPTVEYALLPCNNQYTMVNYLEDYSQNFNYGTGGPVYVCDWEPMFFGSGITFASGNFGNFDYNYRPNHGGYDFVVRQTFSRYHDRTYAFGGSGDDVMTGKYEISEGVYLLYGSSQSPVSGDVSQADFGGFGDYWIIKYDFNTNQKIWDKRFGGNFTDEMISLVPLSNGNFMLLGDSFSGINGSKTSQNFGGIDIWGIIINPNGVQISEFSIGGSGYDRIKKAKKLPNGQILLMGYSNSPISGNKTAANIGDYDYWAVWINESGVIQQQATFGGTAADIATDLLLTEIGDLYLCGSSASGISGNKLQANKGVGKDFWVVKINQSGTVMWSKTFGSDENDEMRAAKETIEGNLVFYGQTDENSQSADKQSINPYTGTGGSDLWILEINSSGNKVTDFAFGDCYTEFIDQATIGIASNGDLILPAMVITAQNTCNPLYRNTYFDYYEHRLNKCMYKPLSTPLCRDSDVLLHTKLRLQTYYGASAFTQVKWMDFSNENPLKINVGNGLNGFVKYKESDLPCFSIPTNFQMNLFLENQTLTGVDFSNFSLQNRNEYAYNKLISTKKITPKLNTSYKAEKAIELLPGFEIIGGNQNIFKAEIAGCVNN